MERADQDLLEKFTDETNDHALFIGWYDYQAATKTLPIAAQVFQVWYFARYPGKLATEVDLSDFERALQNFPNLRGLTRAEQKSAMKRLIQKLRRNRQIMSDPATDQRALILPVD
jgi:hypothetical protein